MHVRGGARIEARAARAGGKLSLGGTLIDDTGRPIPGGKVSLTVAPSSAPQRPLTLPTPERCNGEGALPPTLERADTVSLRVDDQGRFCVRLALPGDAAAPTYVGHLAFATTQALDGTTVDLPIDLKVKPLSLEFDPEPRALSLDDANPFAVEVVGRTDDDDAKSPAVNLLLTLTNESGAVLASGVTNASGRIRFSVSPSALGPPGRGELRVTFGGNSEVGSSTHAAAVERRTHVDLSAPEAAGGRLPSGSPEDGVTVLVAVAPRAGGAPGGSVEARVGDTLVGAAPVERGLAKVVVTFAPPSTPEVPIRVRYAPDAPWFEAGNELLVTLPTKGPSPWRQAPLVLAGLLVLVWLVMSRVSRSRPPRDAAQRPADAPAGKPLVEVLEAAPEGAHAGWRGRVVDAHDGTPVPHARVSFERPGFDGDQLLTATTDAEGRFELPPPDAVRTGDRLRAEGPLHGALVQAAPPSGELRIALMTRKRALLDRLVAWARQRGRPFDGPPEPTPEHVRRAAEGDGAVSEWAAAVEHAAYAGLPVDASREAEVDKLAPNLAAMRPHDRPDATLLAEPPAGPDVPPAAKDGP